MALGRGASIEPGELSRLGGVLVDARVAVWEFDGYALRLSLVNDEGTPAVLRAECGRFESEGLKLGATLVEFVEFVRTGCMTARAA